MTGCFFDRLPRKTIITGHYGSGKTEFTISLAMLLANTINTQQVKERKTYKSLAIIDLDIINPYFRSREQKEMLENTGIKTFGSVFDTESTAEVPALSSKVRAPLQDDSCRVIIDTGGNDMGAVVLNQFTKYLIDDETTMLAVINANRPDTSDIDGALLHIEAIEYITKLSVSGIVNNTHMLRETTASDIAHGNEICNEIFQKTGKYLLCDCYPEGVVDPGELTGLSGNLMPLGLYMRPTWLDK